MRLPGPWTILRGQQESEMALTGRIQSHLPGTTAGLAIARLLNLSQKTVRNHHYAIKAKIGARNNAHLVWRALKSGLFDAGSPTAAEELS